jgi:hypothetical protein
MHLIDLAPHIIIDQYLGDLPYKILTNPTAKYNYVGKLSDPTARGEEAVLLIGVSFDGTPLMNYELGAVGEIELNFTFDDCRYTSTID